MLIRVLTAPVPGHRRDGARTAEPVTFGVPLPKGLVKDPANWTLDGRTVQARVLDRWADGSARWVLVDGQVDLKPEGRGVLELDTDAPAGGRHDGLTITAGGNGIVVNTGVASFNLAPGENLLNPGQCRLTAIDRNGGHHQAVVSRVAVESTGPYRSVVRLDGSMALDGSRKLNLTVRTSFFAGLSAVRLRVTLTNPDAAVHEGGFWDLGDPGSVLFKDVSLHVVPPGEPSPAGVMCSAESGAPLESHSTPFEVYQDSSGGEQWQSPNHMNRERRVPVTFRGYRLRSRRDGA